MPPSQKCERSEQLVLSKEMIRTLPEIGGVQLLLLHSYPYSRTE
jgi:hypothetical protein